MNSYSQTLPLNELLGTRYRIQAVLGEGGFGITYKAWDEKLKRPVVIKEYLPGEMGARDRDTLRVLPRTQREESFRYGLERYLDEAVTLARFKHPNIVQIHDFFEANGTAYIVMEFEEGETLAERLKARGGSLSGPEILALLVPLLQGLRQVHEAGLLHRDIKPGNIFLRKQGGPLLIDFGSARQALGEKSRNLSAIVSQGYAPPEQYSTRGRQGPYSDLYAIGAVLYEAITGQAPVESVDRSHEIMSGAADPLIPAATAGLGKAPAWLLTLTGRMLAISSKDRPQDCDEVLQAIQAQGVALADAPARRPSAPAANKTRLVSEEERFNASLAGGGGRRAWLLVMLLLVPAVGVLAYLGWQGQWAGSGKREAGIVQPMIPVGSTAQVGTPAQIPQTPASSPVVPKPEPVAQTPAPIAPAPEPAAPKPEPPVPATGQLQVSVNVVSATVKLDGAVAGRAGSGAPFMSEAMSSGEHRVEVTADGFPPWQGRAGVRPGEWTRVAVEFKTEERPETRAPSPAPEPPVAPPRNDPTVARCERYAAEDEIPPIERKEYVRKCISALGRKREGPARQEPAANGVRARCERYAQDDGIPASERERYVRQCIASLGER
ncbi:MAG: hypothetical protein A2286_05960 [Gammaproteobacteria bacterium RIFOXYA12_FULL_61_12]|nr:MAG: hypothetical protein A2514_04425 [Gammaproteobacteria bacterium RIFOXYD12_FULL_61_37]OGT94551.1 MAG: hypothetical protein A2286_05960 [Gammaproteobacteria bacterium RIFOXYA12_FULL_61_12]